MKRIGIFLDVSNLYYCIGKKYDKRKLNYKGYLEYVSELGEVVRATAYGTQLNNEAAGFIHCLKASGYQTKYKTVKRWSEDHRKIDWNVGISMDIIRMMERVDQIFIGSADGDLAPLVEYVTQSGVDVVVFACGISKDLKAAATEFIEIPESLLET